MGCLKPVQWFGRWLLAPVLALLCYWPALTVEFGVHNDYSVWSYDKSDWFWGYPESAHLAAIGRPLGAVLLNLHLYPIRTIADFTASRWFAFFVVLFSAWLLARHLHRRVHLPGGFAALAAMCVFTLPSSQVFVFWVGNFVPGSLNVLLALLTYEALDKVSLSGWRRGGWRRAQAIAWLALAGFLFFCSMCIYPPTTLFILVPTFCSLVFSPITNWPQTRLRVLRDMAFTSAGVCSYFLFMRCVIRPVLGHHSSQIQEAISSNQTGLYAFSLGHNVFAWLENAWAALTVALNGVLDPSLPEQMAQHVALALATGLLLAAAWRFLRSPKTCPELTLRAQRGSLLQAGVAALALLVLSECAVIVPTGTSGFMPYRVVYPASAMVVLLLFSVAGQWRLPFANHLPALLARPFPVLILVGCALLGHMTLRAAAGNSHNELVFFREQLRHHDLRTVKGLLVIGAPEGRLFVDARLRSEFMRLATGPCMIYGFADVLLAEHGIRRGELAVRHRHFDPDEYSIVRPGMLVIDMNLIPQGAKTPYLQSPMAMISASGETCNTGNTMHAFDCEPCSFWEARAPNAWLRIDYGQPYQLAEYAFGTVPSAERIPRDWQLLGSHDGAHWTLVDQRRGESDWAPNEVRTFSLAKPARFSSYKVVFTAQGSDIVRLAEWTLCHESSARTASLPNTNPH